MAGTVIYDGGCGFCASSANWLAERGRCEATPRQSLDLAPLGLTEDDVTRAAYWLDASGHVSARGAGTVAEALESCGLVWMIAGHLIYVRPAPRPAAGSHPPPEHQPGKDQPGLTMAFISKCIGSV